MFTLFVKQFFGISYFITDLLTGWFCDEMSMEFFMWCQKFITGYTLCVNGGMNTTVYSVLLKRTSDGKNIDTYRYFSRNIDIFP